MDATNGILFVPPEILGCVSRMLSWLEITLLLMCGNKRLITLLHQPGAVPSLLLDTSMIQSETFKSWPSLLKLNHLRYLGVVWIQPRLNTDLEALWLPETLTELDLTGMPRSLGSLLLLPRPLAEALPNLRHLSMDITLRPNDADWVSTLPPTLTYLGVTRLDDWCPLPASLSSFEVFSDMTQAAVSLPPQMTTFSICASWYPLILAANSLQTLQISGNIRNITNSDILSLPRTIERLTLNTHCQFQDIVPGSFPPRLTSLSLVHFNSSGIFPALPPSLTDLEVYEGIPNPRISIPICIALLPRQLLRFRCTHWIDRQHTETTLQSGVDWPTGLKSLELPTVIFTPDALASIPASTTSLVLGDIDPIDNLETTHLPLHRRIWLELPRVWIFRS